MDGKSDGQVAMRIFRAEMGDFMFEKNLKFPLLLDAYGALLTDRKRELLDYYYNNDYSLSEISELTGISRQGVRDSIKKSEEEITAYESCLGLVRRREAIDEICEESDALLHNMINAADNDSASASEDIKNGLCRLLELIESLRNAADLDDTFPTA